MHPDAIIAAIAEGQFGVVAAAQLHAAGLTARQIRHRVDRGQLERRPGSVLVVRGGAACFEREVVAACLGLGADAAASHRTAAKLLGLDLRMEIPTEISVPRARTPKLPGAVVHRASDLIPDHVVRIGPIATTNPYRLLVDLGSVVPWWTVSRAFEQLIADRRVTPARLRPFLDTIARRGRNGVGVLRQVLDNRALGDQISDSGLEEELAKLYRDAGVQLPAFQYSMWLDGRWRRIDFCYPEHEIAIEVDGYEPHIQYAVFEDDRLRGNELELLGWMILHFTRNMIMRRPGYVARVTREALAKQTRA
jgi:very-short-patch-repair endonuclease